MTKEESIANRVKALIAKNGYTKAQARMIAMSEIDKPKAQQGNWWDMQNYNLDKNIQSQAMSPQQNFSVANQDYMRMAHTPAQPQNNAWVNPTFAPGNYNEWDKDNNGVPDTIQKVEGNPALNPMSQNTATTNWSKPEQINNTNVANLYGGVDLEGALAYAGRGFGEKDPWKAGIGSSLFAVKGVRNFLSGFASGKAEKQTYEDYMKKLYEDQTVPEYRQQGGKIKNSEVMAMNAITDNPQGNINLESGEFVKRNNGMVQPVVGEKHIKNGKIADGVDAQLEGGDKVLSDYIKLRPTDIKELKSRYDISLKKGDTPAKAQSKFDAKIGLKKEESELAVLAEKLEKALKIKDPTTQELSVQALQSKIAKQNEKIAPLKEVSAMAFEDFFMRQESQPKKGDGSQIYDKNGKEVTELSKNVAQQGGEQQAQIAQIVEAYAQASGQDPQQIMEQLQQMPPEEQQQALQMMMQELQGSQEQGNIQEEQMMAQQGGLLEMATKFGISPERAEELIRMQMGGQQDQMQEIMQQVARALQSGASPDEVIEQLLKIGIPQEEVQQIVQQVMSEIQSPQIQEEMMQQGGKMYAQQAVNPFVQNSTLIKDFTQQPSGVTFLPQTPMNTNPNSIWKGDSQNKTGNYYEVWTPLVEQSLSDPEQAKKVDKWLSENKDAYSPNIQKQLEGLTGEARIARIKTLATDGKPGLFHNAVLDALKATKPKEEVKALEKVEESKETDNRISPAQVNNRTVFPSLPVDLRLPPSALAPLRKPEVNLGRIEPIKATIEPYLAEQARQQLTARDQLSATGLPPQIQEALSAQQLASGQMSANDAISKTENFNRANQMQVDQFNIGQRNKEDLANEQFSQVYSGQMLQGIANTENNWRSFYNEGNYNNARNFAYIEDTRTPAQSEYTYVPGKGYIFNNNKKGDMSGVTSSLSPEEAANLSDKEWNDFINRSNEMRKKKQTAMKNQQ
jgi:hypothetical protein